jgi:predicted RND superfamily exporter protein
LVVAVALLGLSQIRVNNSFRDWFYPGSRARLDDDFINGAFGGSSTIEALVQGDAPGALEEPEVVRAVSDVEGLLSGLPEIGKVISYVDLLREIHRRMAVGESAGPLPETRNLNAQYLLLYEMTRGPGGLGALLDADHRYARVTAFARTDEAAAGARIIERLRQFGRTRFAGLPARLRVAGGSIGAQTAMNEVVVREKLWNLAQVSLVIAILSVIALRAVSGAFFVLLPLALAVVVNLGVMGWFRIWLSMATAAITALGVSIGADFAIYLIFRVREETRRGQRLDEAVRASLATAGHAIAFVASAMVLGYMTLMLVGFRTWTQIGGLTALMLTTSALAALTLVPALLLLMPPRFLLSQGRMMEDRSGGIASQPR